jgi:hypothetical protein
MFLVEPVTALPEKQDSLSADATVGLHFAKKGSDSGTEIVVRCSNAFKEEQCW